MTTVRLYHPVINLERAALGLADYYMHADPAEINEIVEKARNQFGRYWISRKLWSSKAKDVVPPTSVPGLPVLFEENDWGEDAVNTNIIRAMMMKLEGYNPDDASKLTYDEIMLLVPTFFFSIERLTEIEANEKKLQMQTEIVQKQTDLEKQLKEMERYERKLRKINNNQTDKTEELEALSRKRIAVSLELSLISDKIEAIQAEKKAKEAALQELEAAFPGRKINYLTVLKTLIALNPARLSCTQIEQAAKLAEDAVLTFIAESRKQREKQADMTSMKEARKKDQALDLKKKEEDDKREALNAKIAADERLKEAQLLCQQGKRNDHAKVRRELSLLLAKRTVKEEPKPAATPPAITPPATPPLAALEGIPEAIIKDEEAPVNRSQSVSQHRPRNKQFQDALNTLSMFKNFRTPSPILPAQTRAKDVADNKNEINRPAF